jgi:hypothetical protein
MAMNIKVPSLPIAASTSTASGLLLPLGNQALRYVRVTNNSATSGCYVNAGAAGVTATSANICLAPFETAVLEREPTTDSTLAVLLQSGTATITAVLVGGAD